jgi:hypothetical protein
VIKVSFMSICNFDANKVSVWNQAECMYQPVQAHVIHGSGIKLTRITGSMLCPHPSYPPT